MMQGQNVNHANQINNINDLTMFDYEIPIQCKDRLN